MKFEQINYQLSAPERAQSFDLDCLYQYGIRKVRVQVHHDRSYPKQSWAKASVWDGHALKWNEVAVALRSAWADNTDLDYEYGTEGMLSAVESLLDQASLVL